MGNSTVITAGVGKLLNKSRVMIDGPISDSLETARLSKSNHKCFMSKSPFKSIKSLVIPVTRRVKRM